MWLCGMPASSTASSWLLPLLTTKSSDRRTTTTSAGCSSPAAWPDAGHGLLPGWRYTSSTSVPVSSLLVQLRSLQNLTPLDVEGQDTWYIKAGIRRKWNHLGATVLYGEYENVDLDGATLALARFELWGLGAVQEIDAAAMSLWLTYRNIEAD